MRTFAPPPCTDDDDMAAQVRYRVTHETRYGYSSTVTSSRQLAHLRPRITPWQELHRHCVAVAPEPAERADGEDYFGNPVLRFAVYEPHDELLVRAESEVTVRIGFDHASAAPMPWEAALTIGNAAGAPVDLEVEQYRVGSSMAPALAEAADYARPSFAAGRAWLDALLELARRIHDDFVYDPDATSVTTRVAEVLAHRRGVCQDFAHLMISCLRALGLPARYVSGYVLNRAPAGGPQLVGADASHAWVASHSPAYGWVAFDPTNAKLAGTEFVTLGWGRDFADVTPLRGVVLGAAEQRLSVAVGVQPI
jgi:transglutaminase-like putative cysteine protease